MDSQAGYILFFSKQAAQQQQIQECSSPFPASHWLPLDLLNHSIGTNGGLLDVLKDVNFFYNQHLPSEKSLVWSPVPLHQSIEFVLQKATSDINYPTFQHTLTSLHFTFAQEIFCLSQEGHCCSFFALLGFL